MRPLVLLWVCFVAIAVFINPSSAQSGGSTWSGAKIQTVTPQVMVERGLSVPFGVLVVEVEKASPAENVGLRAGDILIAAGAKRILSETDLLEVMAGLASNASAEFTVIREGRTEKVAIAPANNPVSAVSAPYLMLDTGGHMGTVRGAIFTSDGNQ